MSETKATHNYNMKLNSMEWKCRVRHSSVRRLSLRWNNWKVHCIANELRGMVDAVAAVGAVCVCVSLRHHAANAKWERPTQEPISFII